MPLDRDWKNFLLNEELNERTIFTYLQGLQEIISNIKPKSMTEERRLRLAKEHLHSARRSARKMQMSFKFYKRGLLF